MTKNGSNQLPSDLSSEAIDELVLSEYPYPIAANYRRMLKTGNWEQRTCECITVFEYALRAITLGALSQYLIQDPDEVNDPELKSQPLQHKTIQS